MAVEIGESKARGRAHHAHGQAWNKVVACYLAWKALAFSALVLSPLGLDSGVSEDLGGSLSIGEPCDRLEMIGVYSAAVLTHDSHDRQSDRGVNL